MRGPGLARFALAASFAAVAALAAPGCFSPPKPSCAFLCGDGNSCPEDYMCSTADNRCHLLVEGQLAVCEDTLPVDAATADAPIMVIDAGADGPVVDAGPPDARVPDAHVPDAHVPDAHVPDASPPPDATPAPDAFVNSAPVMGNVTTPVNVVAGGNVSITVTASDPDPGQTLTFSAPPAGTNRNPYFVRPGDSNDTVGGVFDIGTRTFTMPAGILGRFDINFTVSDGHGGTDTAPASVIVAAHPVRVNEVQLGTTAATRNVELVNTGTGTVDVSGWELWVGSTSSTVLPASTSIAAGDFLVLHADMGTNDDHNLFMITALDDLATANEVTLYQTPTDVALSRFIRDFVKWGAGAGRIDQAFFAGQWPSTAASSFVDTSVVTDFDTVSIARIPGSTAESAAAWYIEDMPSFGAANTP
jgi:hypothetical protein